MKAVTSPASAWKNSLEDSAPSGPARCAPLRRDATVACVCSSCRSMRPKCAAMTALRAATSGACSMAPDLLQRHAEVAQPADDLRGRDLTGPVQPVTGRRIDVRRLQQAYLVAMTRRLDAQVGHPGEVADRQQHVDGPYDEPSCNRRVKPASPQW